MDITLASERLFRLIPKVSLEVARAKVEEKKVSLIAGTLGSLLSRPNPADIALVAEQQRWEPFWHLMIHLRTVYERHRDYQVVIAGNEVKQVTLFGQTLPVESGKVQFTGLEHCVEEDRLTRTLTGAGAPMSEGARLVDLPSTELTDPAAFQADGWVANSPEVSAGAIIRQVLAEVIKPVKAEVIHEERLTIETVGLYFRPIFAFEYHWTTKGKRAVVQCDGLTGELKLGGSNLGTQIRKMLSRDVLFDISADAVGTVIPLGGVVVKLTKAAIDLKR